MKFPLLALLSVVVGLVGQHGSGAAQLSRHSLGFIVSKAHPGLRGYVPSCLESICSLQRPRDLPDTSRMWTASGRGHVGMSGKKGCLVKLCASKGEGIDVRGDYGDDREDERLFIIQVEEIMRNAKELLGQQIPDGRVLDEAVGSLEAAMRMITARTQAEGGNEQLSELSACADVLLEELRRLSYNSPTPWQMSFKSFSPQVSQKPAMSPSTFSSPAQEGLGRFVREKQEQKEEVAVERGAESSSGADDVILRAEQAVREARSVMGYMDAGKKERMQMDKALDELASVLSILSGGSNSDPKAAAAKLSVETAEEQLRELMYLLPPLPPKLPSFSLPNLMPAPPRTVESTAGTSFVVKKRAQQAEAAPGGGVESRTNMALPRNLSGVKSLSDLLALFSPILASPSGGGGLSGCDAATAMNQLKRLGRQAQDAATMAEVESAMITFGQAVVCDKASLQPRHVALALNALGDLKMSVRTKERGGDLEVGSAIPERWNKGREFDMSRRNTFVQGEPVIVSRSDGSLRFGCVDKVQGSQYLVRVSVGMRDAAFFRRESSASLGKLLLPWARRQLQRRDLCLSIGAILLEDRSMLGKCSARDLASTMWAHAKVDAMNEALFLAIGNQIRKEGVLDGASAQDMATLLWAHADLGWPNKKLFKAVGDVLLKDGFLLTCNEQDLSLFLWAHARMKLSGDGVCDALAARASTISFTNVQAVSNTLWALAELNMQGCDGAVTNICEQLRWGGLARQASVQSAANSLWALGVLKQQDSPSGRKLLSVMLSNAASLDIADKCQLHQFFLSRQLCGSPTDGDTEEVEALRADCAAAFIDVSSKFQRASTIQMDVSQLISQLGFKHMEEYVLPGIGYSVDVWLPEKSVAVEVQGPNHFLSSGDEERDARFTGGTELKMRHLNAWGVKVVSLAYYDLDRMALWSSEQRKEWMLQQINAAS